MPLPNRLVKPIVPPCASAIALQIARPQPGASPVAGAAGVDPVEAVEDAVLMLGGDALAGVADPEVDPAILRPAAGDHRSPGGVWASALSIRLTSSCISRSSSATSGAARSHRERDTRLLGHRGVLLENEAHGIGEVEWRAVRGELPGIGARQGQQRADKRGHPRDIAVDTPATPRGTLRSSGAEPGPDRPGCASG